MRQREYFFGRNRGIEISNARKHPMLFGENGVLPKHSFNGFSVGNCAEVDAINKALNAGSELKDLKMLTIYTYQIALEFPSVPAKIAQLPLKVKLKRTTLVGKKTKMNRQVYKNLSASGKVAFLLLCAENFALKFKPTADWKPLFRKMWGIFSTASWDEWASRFVEAIPSCLEDPEDYKSGNFEFLSREDYETLLALYEDMGKDWDTLLDDIHVTVLELGNDFEDPAGLAKESFENILSILAKHEVRMPKKNLEKLFPASDDPDYRTNFDPNSISRVLK